MKSKTLIAALLIGAGASAFSGLSFAQRGDCIGGGPMMGERGQNMRAERQQMHQQRLHDALKLTPAQEGAWKKFQESRPYANPDQKRPDPAEVAKLSAPERAEKMLDFQKQHQEAMTKHVAAMKEFYGQLTPEQKKTFDDQTQFGMRGKQGGPRGGMGGGMGPGMGGGMRGPGPQGPANPPPAN